MQVRKAIAAAEAAGAERTGLSKRLFPTPLAGIAMQHVPVDYQQVFGRPLDYKDMGHDKLSSLLRVECSDFLNMPGKLDQYAYEVCCQLGSDSLVLRSFQ